VGRARLLRKADQVVQGNRISMADQVALVFREDLEAPVDRVVLAGRARLPRKADQAVQGNRISMADQEALVSREDREVQVDRVGRVVPGNPMGMADLEALVVLAGQAPIKQGFLVVLGKVARGASHRTARRTANTSRKVIRPVRAST
jgi:hypothetical protein